MSPHDTTTVKAHGADVMAGSPSSISKRLLFGMAPCQSLKYLNTYLTIFSREGGHMAEFQTMTRNIHSNESFYENSEFLDRRDKCDLRQYPLHLPIKSALQHQKFDSLNTGQV